MSTTVNIKIEFQQLGTFSYTRTLAPTHLSEGAAEEAPTRPLYTFPKPVASWEPEPITF